MGSGDCLLLRASFFLALNRTTATTSHEQYDRVHFKIADVEYMEQ